MKIGTKAMVTVATAVALVAGVALPANAASVTYGAKECVWPAHAFVEATTTGTPTLKITAGNGTLTSKQFNSSSEFARNYLNSSDEDAKNGSASGYKEIQSGGMGCSI